MTISQTDLQTAQLILKTVQDIQMVLGIFKGKVNEYYALPECVIQWVDSQIVTCRMLVNDLPNEVTDIKTTMNMALTSAEKTIAYHKIQVGIRKDVQLKKAVLIKEKVQNLKKSLEEYQKRKNNLGQTDLL